MAFLPVVSREMSVLARRPATYRSRAINAGIAVLTMIWLLVVVAARVTPGALGSSIFFTIAGFCFVFALLAGMHVTADCVSEEKREGTLGLLFLTDLRGMHIIAGKMVASSFSVAFAVLGVVPMLTLAILLGGVTLQQVGWMAVVLLNTLFLSLSIGVLVSTLSNNERRAMVACFVALFAITVLPFVISLALSEMQRITPWMAFLSPLYSFISVQAGVPAAEARFFGASILLQNALAWLALLAASRILPRCVHSLPSQRFSRLRAVIDAYVYGKREQRQRYRARLLDRNAFLWLASRERIKPRYAWGIVVFFAVLFGWVAVQFRDMIFDLPVVLAIIFLVHIIFKVWTASEVCTRLIQDRRSGALELLLTSPLGVRELVKGQGLSLWRIFGWPIVVLLCAEICLMAAMMRARAPQVAAEHTAILFLAGITTLLIDVWAIKWLGMWLSLFGKSIERVMIATLARVLLAPWIAFGVVAGSIGALLLLQAERISATNTYLLWWGISLVFAAGFGLSARSNLLRYFREIASEEVHPRVLAAKAWRVARAERSFLSVLVAEMRRRWVLTLAASSVCLGLLVVVGRQVYWKAQLSKELSLIRARNQPLTPAAFGRLYPVVPPAENAFELMRRSGAINWSPWMHPSFATQLIAGALRGDTNTLENCRQLVGRNKQHRAVLNELERYDKAYLDPFQQVAFGVQRPANGYLALASAEVALGAQDHDSARVETALGALLKIAQLFRAQPVMDCQVAASEALKALALGCELALQRNLLSSDALLTLQRGLDVLEEDNPLYMTINLERVRLLQFADNPGASFPSEASTVVAAANGLLGLAGAKDKLLANALRDYRSAIESAVAGPAALVQRIQETPADSRNPSPLRWVTAAFDLQGHVSQMVSNELLATSRIRALRLAVAAERYRRAQGSWPPDAVSLVPVFLQSVPSDPFTGGSYHMEASEGALLVRGADAIRTAHQNPEPVFLRMPVP